MPTNQLIGGLAAMALMVTAVASAQGPVVQFSAEAVQMAPDKQMRSARMYVGQDRVRMEYEQNGKRVAELVDWKQGQAILLMLDQGTYMEQNAPAEALGAPSGGQGDLNPCTGLPGAQCKHLGTETLSGRPVDKWEMMFARDGKTERSLHWIDSERRMPMRQFWPDGSVVELKPLGVETMNGRRVEKWEQVSSKPDGESMRVTQWYDPELEIAIREELPGGYFRELRDIQVGAQPAQLFQIPAGFRRVEIPVQQGAAPGAGAGQPPQR